MVWDLRLPATRFLTAVRHSLPRAEDHDLLEYRAGTGHGRDRFVPAVERREREARELVVTALDAITSAPNRDAGTIWLRAAIGFAATQEQLEPLFDLVDGRRIVPGVNIDQDMRWALAIKGVAYGSEEAEERVAAERSRDPSDRGDRAVIRAAAARPKPEAKAEAWERIHGDGFGSYHLTRAAMQGFQSFRQRELLLPYRDAFFERVREVFATRDHPYARAYLLNLLPDLWPSRRCCSAPAPCWRSSRRRSRPSTACCARRSTTWSAPFARRRWSAQRPEGQATPTRVLFPRAAGRRAGLRRAGARDGTDAPLGSKPAMTRTGRSRFSSRLTCLS